MPFIIDNKHRSRYLRGIKEWHTDRYELVDVVMEAQGQFDAYVQSELKKLKQEYPQINYAVVLAYVPGKKTEYDDYSDTMLPGGIESVHPHYAISWRNNWMLKQSDYVVTYITHTYGGAAQYALKARKWNKIVMEITLDKFATQTQCRQN